MEVIDIAVTTKYSILGRLWWKFGMVLLFVGFFLTLFFNRLIWNEGWCSHTWLSFFALWAITIGLIAGAILVVIRTDKWSEKYVEEPAAADIDDPV